MSYCSTEILSDCVKYGQKYFEELPVLDEISSQFLADRLPYDKLSQLFSHFWRGSQFSSNCNLG